MQLQQKNLLTIQLMQRLSENQRELLDRFLDQVMVGEGTGRDRDLPIGKLLYTFLGSC